MVVNTGISNEMSPTVKLLAKWWQHFGHLPTSEVGTTMNQQCERGEEMLARKKTTTRVYRSCCTVPAEPSCLQSLQFPDPAMLQTQTDKVLKIMFQQSLRGQGKTCKEMREVSQQSLRGHSLTCKEMRIFPTELEGSEPDLQRDEGVFPTELEGSWPDLQRDEEVFQLESVEGCYIQGSTAPARLFASVSTATQYPRHTTPPRRLWGRGSHACT